LSANVCFGWKADIRLASYAWLSTQYTITAASQITVKELVRQTERVERH
jgi:hypothetical protein